jgi:type IV pilus assembly protein PilA
MVSEALSLASGSKIGIMEYYELKNSFPASLTEIGATTSGKHTESLVLNEDGSITATMKTSSTHKKIAGKTLILKPHLQDEKIVSWDCYGGTIDNKYRPSSCVKE